MFSASPCIHTPALQRCTLEIGQSEQLQVAHIDRLGLRVKARSQRYQCLHQANGQTTYCCHAEGKHSHELTVDRDALLIKANDQFIRLSAHNLSLNTWV